MDSIKNEVLEVTDITCKNFHEMTLLMLKKTVLVNDLRTPKRSCTHPQQKHVYNNRVSEVTSCAR